MLHGLTALSYRERLDGWDFFSLNHRRLRVDIEMYTIMRGIDKVNAHRLFPLPYVERGVV